ncbi:amidohydrolase [Deinobacterium chartae]|uniref:Amidohydrolase n=1 Tax=Deinobacterium chartae TaxID=521158 RepID=A0A841HZR4_9DEIO|nr:amidohydrolase [Deinobacterium chartae]MBB6097498.1 amidohydrolase [Deinobacterium chartae]
MSLPPSTATPEALPPEALARVIAWRRHLHRHPEPSFGELQTAAFVRRTLEDLGGGPRQLTPNSVTLDIGEGGPVVALRADMDALPILEETGLEFASQNPGFMHACGHDAHTAMLLGAAECLLRRPPAHGRVRLIFQHAEEIQPGGAQELVRLGVLEDVRAIVGLHVWAPLEAGTLAVHTGPAMASNDAFTLTVRGRGGHAALPHQATDVIAAAAQVVVNLQQAAARALDPLEPAVISVTQFNGGHSYNVLPDAAVLRGTARAFSPALRATLPELIERVARSVAAAHGAEVELEYQHGFAPVINDPGVVARVLEAARRVPGLRVRQDWPPCMASEDFSAYQAAVPGAFVFLGVGGAGYAPHHHPRFVLEEGALGGGVRLLEEAARELLTQVAAGTGQEG